MPVTVRPLIHEIVDQYFDEATFLWSQRRRAVTAADYTRHDLSQLDERLEASIDGLRSIGDHGWALCRSGLRQDRSETLFPAAVIAFESNDWSRIEAVIDTAEDNPDCFRAVVSGLGWMRRAAFNDVIANLVRHEMIHLQMLGIAACGLRRVNPKNHLDAALDVSDLALQTRSLRAAGELKREDLLPRVLAFAEHEDQACRFEALRSAALLGDRSTLAILLQFAQTKSAFQLPALQTVLRLLDAPNRNALLKSLAGDPEQFLLVLQGMAVVGDPAFVPSLIRQMRIPGHARAAGHVFSMITGVNLVETRMEAEPPEDFDAGPNDDKDDPRVAMDEEEYLSWPDADKVAEWWDANESAFDTGQRYFAGEPVCEEQCERMLETGLQPQRAAAALELALAQPSAPWVNVEMPLHSGARD